MGKGSKKPPKFDEATLVKYFYYHLWKGRMVWIKHVIPVRTIDPNTGFFVEGYLSAPPVIDELDQKVDITLAFLPIYTKNEISVPINYIYPSKRKITIIIKNEVTLFTHTQIDFNPTHTISEDSIENIFNYYRGMSFTIAELESFINNKLSDDLKKTLIQDGVKQCMIDGVPNNSFNGISTSIYQQPNKEPKMAEKVMTSLQELYLQYQNCSRCELGKNRLDKECGEPTFGRLGNTLINQDIDTKTNTSLIMFIGEAPGMQEEETKIAFYPKAPAGGVLDKVIAAANIAYDNCYFTNSVLCRPHSTNGVTQNSKPEVEHIKSCNTRLKNEVAIVKPKIIVLLGRVAYRAFYGKDPKSVLEMIGWLNENKTIYFAPHPSFVVRELTYATPENKASIKNKYLDHFKEIKARYDSQ
jgi:DNA polymerase